MTAIIVGSTALAECRFSPRQARDTDVWHDGTWTDIKTVDNHYIPTEILNLVPVVYGVHHLLGPSKYATPEAVYTIKLSHLAWDIKWQKHISDVMYLKRKGCKIIPELYKALYKHWQVVHKDKSFLSLDKTKEQFFNDYVDYKYDHDYLHEIVALPQKPMYSKVLQDNKEVLISHVKFMQMSFEDQVKLFREEIQVIALERFLIPNDFKRAKYKAYLMALKKTITNLTKNWATLFILDNYT